MQTVNISNTDIHVSVVGLGTVKLGRNTAVKYPKAFSIPSDTEALNILNRAAECGINIVDTAPAYGNSEERLGELLKKTSQEWIVSTKVGEHFNADTGESSYQFTPEYIQQSIENSLRKLQREHLDIVLVHSNGADEKIIREYGALDTLQHLKQKGLIRATGMSTKTVNGGILAAQQSDIVMVTHNIAYQEEQPVIEFAHCHNKNIFIKKAFASGHSTTTEGVDTVTQSFDCIFQHPGVSSIILGSINPKHIKENAEKAIASFARYHSTA
jgi:aryl-alcohol dehydrogenase-like predicted oxidoreductase